MNKDLKILIVEDSPTQAKQLQYVLEGHGYEVLLAANGEEGLTWAHKVRPALIISDIIMPVVDGFEMCGKIKSDKTLKDTPVILLTTLSDLEDIIRGLNVKADCYVTKPWNEEFLISKIEEILTKKTEQKSKKAGKGLEFIFAGKRHRVTSNRQQMLNLLLSTYENAVLQNRELIKAQESLEELNDDLEKNLHELGVSEERFRSLVRTIPDIVYRIDVNGQFTFINNAIERLGYAPEELIGQHFSTIIVPDAVEGISRNKLLPKYAGKTTGDKSSPKLFDERRTGDRMTIGLEVQLVLKNRERLTPALMELIGDEFLDIEVNSAGMYHINPTSQEATIIGTVGVIRDITYRKELEENLLRARDELEIKVEQRTLELRKTNEALEREIVKRTKVQEELQELFDKLKQSTSQLMQSEKMSAIGTLVAGVAHEMNNPMMGILNFAEYCRKYTDGEDRRYPVLESIERETKRCIKIMKNLLTFSRLEKKGDETYQKISFDVIIDRVTGLLSHRIDNENVLLKRHVAEGDREIWMEPGSMQQLLLNYISNALDAVKETRKKEVTVEVLPGKEFIEVKISDTGCGIEPVNLQRIYDPFFTTKPTGQGTGLGLSVSQSIIEKHGGNVHVASDPGVGTTFEILFPIDKRGGDVS